MSFFNPTQEEIEAKEEAVRYAAFLKRHPDFAPEKHESETSYLWLAILLSFVFTPVVLIAYLTFRD